jgi:hypothetical protein
VELLAAARHAGPNLRPKRPRLHASAVLHRRAAFLLFREIRGFYLYAIKKDDADLCVTKKIVCTCVPST